MYSIKRYLLYFLIIIVLIGAVALGFWLSRVSKNTYDINMNKQTVIQQIRELQRLETASYTIEKVIDAGTAGNAFQEFLYGDRILLIAHGEIIAGFDLSELKEDDIVIDGENISLTLPSPRILVTKLDNEKTRVFDRKQGLLTKGDKDLEATARAEAEKAITQAACEGDILDEASKNAKNQLVALLKALNFVNPTIIIPSGSC